jgi:autotransporter-associated beta strand protein
VSLNNPNYDGSVGAGGGGSAAVTAGSVTLTDSSLNLTGGNGGGVTVVATGAGSYGIDSPAGSVTVASGSGGNVGVTAGSVTLSGSNLTLTGGNGGGVTVGASGGGTGILGSSVDVTAGNGGNASVSLGSLNMDSNSTLALTGGTGGQVTGISGTNGTVGSASATLGSLTGAGTVTMYGSTANLRVASGNFSGVIEGNESLNVAGGGALTLSGNNTYSGGTAVNGGTLLVDTGGSLGSGAVTNNATLSYIDSATAGNAVILNNAGLNFYDNSTAGGASITTNSHINFTDLSTAGSATITTNSGGQIDFYTSSSGGTARFVLNGTGSMDISGETDSSVTVGSIEGSGFVGLGANNLATGANNLSTSFSGIIADGGGNGGVGGSLTKIGTGTLTLTGANSYTGGTLISAGILQVDTGGTLGSGPVTNNAVLNYIDSATAGGSAITNTGNGTIQFLNNSTAGNSNIANATDGNVIFDGASSAAGATFANNGTLIFYNTSTAGSACITTTGIVRFSNSSTAGSATITANNGGQIDFYPDALGGTARLILNGTGTLDISPETLNAAVTVGSFESSGSVSLGGDSLTTGANNLNTSFSGNIADGGINGGSGGSLTKIGSGTLTLSGDNTYTGGTTINGGTLVAASGNALGTGNASVSNGTLMVGGPRTLGIGGNYIQASTGTLQLGLGGITLGDWDMLNISGAATLAGTLKLASYGGFEVHDTETFAILGASNVSGTFNSVVNGLLGDSMSLSYEPNEVLLELTGPTFESLGSTTNQKNIGAALDNLANHSGDPALISYLDTQANSALPGIYNQISPADLTPLYQMSFASAQAQGGMVSRRLSQLFGQGGPGSNDISWNGPRFAANVPASEEAGMAKDLEPRRWGVFANGMGNFGTVTGDGNAPGYQYSTGGTTAGVDYRFSKSFVGGLLLGYSQSGTSQSAGAVNLTGGQAGLYAGWKQDAFHVEALAEGGINSYTTQRNTLGGTAAGSTQGQQYSGELNIGYDFKVGQVRVGPYVSGQYTSVNINAFNEMGSLSPLSFSAQSEGYLSSDLGAAASRKWDLGGVILSPALGAAWEHVYQGNLDSLTANFGTGNNFTVNGPATGTDAAVLSAGLNALFGKGFNAFVQYQGKAGLTNYSEQNVSGGVNIGF